MGKRKKPQLRLVRNNQSVFVGARLDGHLFDAKLAATQHLYLVRPEIRDDPVPHGNSFPGTAQGIGKGLMGATEVLDDVFENDGPAQIDSLQYASSVSMLPSPVKALTNRTGVRVRKLAYMSKRGPKDPWSVERGKKMRQARERLGYSQEEVAKFIELPNGYNPTRESISQYESGSIKEIDPILVPQFVRVLGLNVSEISRVVTGVKDEGADLMVSSVARSIAYKFDRFPLFLQMQIRQFINIYEESVAPQRPSKKYKKSAKA